MDVDGVLTDGRLFNVPGPDGKMVGKSTSVNQLRQVIERVAPANSRIMITGYSGAGKELTARLIHAHSARSEAPFVVVNAPAITPEGMESELFGVEPGPDRPKRVGALEERPAGELLVKAAQSDAVLSRARVKA